MTLTFLAKRSASDIVTRALVLYCAVVFVLRMAPSFMPYVAQTDWKQWVWQYHRYASDGALPAGHVITDYTMMTQPPAYWVAMASMSTVISPIHAAIILNMIAFAAALYFTGRAVARRTTPLIGAAAAALLARDEVFHSVTCGGYPRTFGPTLTIAFLALWLEGRHRWVLAVLIAQAAMYPSVVVPCGLAYGVWSVLFAGRAGWWRRNLELAATTVVVAFLSLLQNLRAPEWWGRVIGYEEALLEPALGPEGRMAWAPLGPFWTQVFNYVSEPFGIRGLLRAAHVYPWTSAMIGGFFLVVTIVVVGAAVVLPRRRAASLDAALDAPSSAAGARRMPWQPFALAAACVLSFFAARVLAFHLYLPHRVVQHTLPYIVPVIFAVAAYVAARALFSEKRAQWAALALVLSPFVLAGDGLSAKALRSYGGDRPLYEWIEENTPIAAQFAGNLQPLDEIPLFARRQMYVNWKMSHPFRVGYYDEIERRILAMYDAFYANDIDTVLAFAKRENIDYFVVDRRHFTVVEKGDGQLFEPLRTRVAQMFAERKDKGFALAQPPAEAVVFRHRVYDVIDVKKLEGARRDTSGEP